LERISYERMAEQDSTHWWYVARRQVLATLLERRLGPADPERRILEIGCGTGHNLPMLARFGTLDAIELDDQSRDVAQKRLGRPIYNTRLPALEGLPPGQYDVIALLDVLEHIEDDRGALKAIAGRLKPGGTLLLTVPQHPWMWSGHDAANHHFRRYTRAGLEQVIAQSGLKTDLLQSFNSLLFPLAAADRLRARLTGREGAADAEPAAPVNALFKGIFGLERHLIGRVPMPPGVSMVALLTAP
jgi:SAM-dependent methyltransferase